MSIPFQGMPLHVYCLHLLPG